MTWGEALRLTQVLVRDPSSAVGAAHSDLDYPVDRASLVLMEVYDSLEVARAGKKAKPFPRPWTNRKARGAGTRMTVDALRALLDSHRNKEGASDG